MWTPRTVRGPLAALAATVVAAAACGTAPERDGTGEPPWQAVAPADPTTVLTGDSPAELALATSEALFASAPVVTLASADAPEQPEASALAAEVGAPLLLVPSAAAGAGATDSGDGGTADDDNAGDGAATTDDGTPTGEPPDTALARELDRLGTDTVVTLDDHAAGWAASLEGIEAVPAGASVPAVERAEPLAAVLVLTLTDEHRAAATVTAEASGAQVVTMETPDPRAEAATVEAISAQPVDQVVALGGDFGEPERVRRHVEVAATGVQLPGGGQLVYPGRRMVALYGHPTSPELGAMGEQPVEEAVARAEQKAAEYQQLVDEPVIPTFEIITTVASRAPGPEEHYTVETPIEEIRPWVDAAADAGMYVVLDLQPGRTDFLSQAKRYEELLLEPHVGLALDPEWRLAPHQVHLEQIGSVDAAEVNEVSQWLADLTREHQLPQKLLVLHQFRLDMLPDRGEIDASHEELAVLIHADGHGTPEQKFATWEALLAQDGPDNLWWGWKNFLDEDRPTFTPAETYEVEPAPLFVSYQ